MATSWIKIYVLSAQTRLHFLLMSLVKLPITDFKDSSLSPALVLSYAQEILRMSFFLETLPCWNKTVLVIFLGLLDEWQPWAVDKELSCMCNWSLYRVSQMYILTEKVKKTQEECPASGPQSFNPLKCIQYHICLGGWKIIPKQGIFSFLEAESSNLFPSMAIT